MYRKAMEKLAAWKESRFRKPLILTGARQVGKTWLMREFGRLYFEDVCYINFENPGSVADIFEGTIVPSRILELLGAYHGHKINPEKTLLVFDEVQEVPRALTALKYFQEEAPEYAICCAGSLLGVTLHAGTSFPVGKVDFISIEPMSFEEFLLANGEEELLSWTKEHYSEEMPAIFSEKYVDYLKKYFIIGGMPTAVNAWIETKDFSVVSEEQRKLLFSYENDFSKHAPENVVPKIHHIWNSIPSQLAKENKKFVYGLAREGARAREYEDALLWLKDSGLIRKAGRVSGGRIPLKAYEDLKAFKIYYLDVGLLRISCEIEPDIILDEQAVFREFMGSLTEQFVLQELQTVQIAPGIYYWSENSRSEVDFIFQYHNNIIPVEAKAGLSVHAQSLRVFCKKYEPKFAIRTSLRNYRVNDGLINLPLYLLWNCKAVLDEEALHCYYSEGNVS
ncbi:MAG: AAA family ATPase [Clostridiales bacterium]|nr:AAA family ATPase [Clostridiales bacterium]